MQKKIYVLIYLVSVIIITGCSYTSDPEAWSDEKIDKWFADAAFLNGWEATPDESIDKREFAIAYNRNKERWDQAFSFLNNTNLGELEVKRHDIDGDNLYAIVNEYVTKNEEDVRFEAHKIYADIQYVISGSEQMSVAPATKKGEVLSQYDESNDIEFMTVTESTHHVATPGRFFLFFPSDLHRPGVRSGENAPVRKIVLKVRL